MTQKWNTCRLALAASMLTISPLCAQNQPAYCAFEVTVQSPTGAPVAGAEVSELQSGGRLYGSATTNERGTARICDAPQGLVDLHVGGQVCGAVTVGYLEPYWMTTRRVVITYENCQGADFVPPGGCFLTIRIRDQAGSPLQGVILNDPNERPMKREQTRVSDQFGRIFRFLDYGDDARVQLQKDGYLPQTLTSECRPGQKGVWDRTVTLEKTP